MGNVWNRGFTGSVKRGELGRKTYQRMGVKLIKQSDIYASPISTIKSSKNYLVSYFSILWTKCIFPRICKGDTVCSIFQI